MGRTTPTFLSLVGPGGRGSGGEEGSRHERARRRQLGAPRAEAEVPPRRPHAPRLDILLELDA